MVISYRYCTQILDKDIDNCCTALLQDLVRFQDRLYHKDPVKVTYQYTELKCIVKPVKKRAEFSVVKYNKWVLTCDIEYGWMDGCEYGISFNVFYILNESKQ